MRHLHEIQASCHFLGVAPLSTLATLQQFLAVEAMQRWWGVARGPVEPRVGGIWVLGWDLPPQGYRYVTTGIIVAYKPEKSCVSCSAVTHKMDVDLVGPPGIGAKDQGYYLPLAVVLEQSKSVNPGPFVEVR